MERAARRNFQALSRPVLLYDERKLPLLDVGGDRRCPCDIKRGEIEIARRENSRADVKLCARARARRRKFFSSRVRARDGNIQVDMARECACVNVSVNTRVSPVAS